jgi:hypothetical protein
MAPVVRPDNLATSPMLSSSSPWSTALRKIARSTFVVFARARADDARRGITEGEGMIICILNQPGDLLVEKLS